jgi:hypothetical protein
MALQSSASTPASTKLAAQINGALGELPTGLHGSGATTFLQLEPGHSDGEHVARRSNQILRRFEEHPGRAWLPSHGSLYFEFREGEKVFLSFEGWKAADGVR